MYTVQPGRRFALDRDGSSVLVRLSSGEMLQLPSGTVSKLMSPDESQVVFNATGTPLLEDSTSYTPTSLWVMFPEPRDVYSICVLAHRRYSSGGNFYYAFMTSGFVYASRDTTTGIDGTWDSFGEYVGTGSTDGYYGIYSGFGYAGTNPNDVFLGVPGYAGNPRLPSMPLYRSRAVPLVGDFSGVRCLRLDLADRGSGKPYRDNSGIYDYVVQLLHLYGRPSDESASHDALGLWHPSEDRRIAQSDIDMGDVVTGSTSTRSFRVKNLSSSRTAESVTVNTFFYVDSTPSLQTQYKLSTGDGSWTDSLNLGDLPPGSFSGVLLARRQTSLSSQFLTHALGVQAAVGSWA